MVVGNVKLCRECRHLNSREIDIRSSIFYDYPELPPIRIIELECDHWLNEELDDIEREIDRI